MPTLKRSEVIPTAMKEIFEKINSITNPICKQYLNDEYALLAKQATAALCRKRPTPFTGSLTSWACGIVYALGIVNFLFDKSQKPYIKAEDLCMAFQLSKSTGHTKAKMVLNLLKANRFNANWVLPSRLDTHPMAWMIMFNGFIVDVRQLPIEVQLMAYEKGLIPKMPPELVLGGCN
jgi:hypothetical protein